MWDPALGAGYYIVTAYDAYSGRSLGLTYDVYGTSITMRGLPLGSTIEFVVQVGCGAWRRRCWAHVLDGAREAVSSAPSLTRNPTKVPAGWHWIGWNWNDRLHTPKHRP